MVILATEQCLGMTIHVQLSSQLSDIQSLDKDRCTQANPYMLNRLYLLDIVNQIIMFIVTWTVFSIYPTPYDMPIWGSTILLSFIDTGYCTVYRPSYSGMIQAQFAAVYSACKSKSVIHSCQFWLIHGSFIILQCYLLGRYNIPLVCCCILSLVIYQHLALVIVIAKARQLGIDAV